MATRGTQIADSRSLLDEPTEAFFLNAELVRWLNEADTIFSTELEPYEASTTFNIVAGKAQYTMPTNITRIKAVYVNGNLIDEIDIKQQAVYDNSGTQSLAVTASGVSAWWRQFGQYILIFPTPESSLTNGCKVIYYGTSPNISFASTTASSQLPINYHDAAPLYAAYKGKLKQQEYEKASALLRLFQARVTDAKRQWHPRNRASLPTVRDEDDLNYYPLIFDRA